MEGDVAYTLLYYPHNIDKLLNLGVGNPRWNGSTPLIGAIMSNQPSIVHLIDEGADVHTTTLGWRPLNVADSIFCNAKKEFPAAAARSSARQWGPNETFICCRGVTGGVARAGASAAGRGIR